MILFFATDCLPDRLVRYEAPNRFILTSRFEPIVSVLSRQGNAMQLGNRVAGRRYHLGFAGFSDVRDFEMNKPQLVPTVHSPMFPGEEIK